MHPVGILCRGSLDAELNKYVAETYPKGTCAVYSTSGKDSEGPGADFEFAVVISAAKHSPQNFWYVIFSIYLNKLLKFMFFCLTSGMFRLRC